LESAYDIIVIGGGHAGAEAAWAAARMGCRTALVTMSVEAIGRMSCNPAIGGLGKGQIVREIDALGGLMGLATDAGGIQFRMLNRSKGPAVWAPRAQADQNLYSKAVRELLRSVPGLEIIESTVDSLIAEKGGSRSLEMTGVRLQDGRELRCRAVVVTTGTFLNGLMHCGEHQTVGGRIDEPAAAGLSDSLRELGLVLARLKTGTPPRVLRDSVDLDQLATQDGDDPPVPFSFITESIDRPQIHCWITHTNERTHELIRNNLHRAPMYSGQIKSHGPRYCPSIEDKIVRFADKPSHQLFLEPEGIDHQWIYCNGISTSLPRDVQEQLVHSIDGLEKAEIAQYGYAIEYDWVPTDQIKSTLETKQISGLYLAGQINGTSGYEEAAAQGLMASVNAVLKLRNEEPLVLGRDEAYIGVMIDDIVTRPPDEPYRMFTSRAEYRLHLRSDNADVRLTPVGRHVGLVDDRRWAAFETKRNAIERFGGVLAARRFEGRSLAEWLRRPEVDLEDLAQRAGDLELAILPVAVREAVEINAKYAGYLQREQRQIERFRKLEARKIPESFDYASVSDLRHEAREKFGRLRPRSIGQAARISGISPADIATLSIHLMRDRR
jgi:tRNA uridine 5-carboxymethylaminomethyl modification enzyme